jgi:hypothetical protein
MPITTWTVVYDSNANIYTIDTAAPIAVTVLQSIETIYKQLGIPTNGITLSGNFPLVFPDISIMDPNKYIYIKSFTLSQKKENNFNSNILFENVVGRMLVRVPYKSTQNTYFNGLNQIIFPLNVVYNIVDFRLEFASGRLVELNGQDWSLLLIFATF